MVLVHLFEELLYLWRCPALVRLQAHVLQQSPDIKHFQKPRVLFVVGIEHVVDPQELRPVLAKELVIDLGTLRNSPFSCAGSSGRALFELQQPHVNHFQIQGRVWPHLLLVSLDERWQGSFGFVEAQFGHQLLEPLKGDSTGTSGGFHLLDKKPEMGLRPLLEELPTRRGDHLGPEGLQRDARGMDRGLLQQRGQLLGKGLLLFRR
mmetsp:Transcript_44527/g.105992  ORF Transcript_44527/g.105992 Transcript_44527/m.105992 type:complete len:206 (+) Transcript_44527:456-1073(+)